MLIDVLSHNTSKMFCIEINVSIKLHTSYKQGTRISRDQMFYTLVHHGDQCAAGVRSPITHQGRWGRSGSCGTGRPVILWTCYNKR